jgi:hypothetical protein
MYPTRYIDSNNVTTREDHWDSNGGSRSGVPTTWIEAPEIERNESKRPLGPGLVSRKITAAKAANLERLHSKA